MNTTIHQSFCVHRLGHDHPTAECGRCELGDCLILDTDRTSTTDESPSTTFCSTCGHDVIGKHPIGFIESDGVNTTTDPPDVQARRNAATLTFKEKAHGLYHRTNGDSAPCHMCGNIPKGQRGFAI